VLAATPAARPAEPPVTVEPLAGGVWLARAPEAAPGGLHALVVERDDGLLVVDTLGSPAAATALLRRLEAEGMKPVRYLVFTHVHADATGGASAFPASTLVIASERAHEAMAEPATDIGGEARARAADPSAWAEPTRRLPVLSLPANVRLEDSRNPVELIPTVGGHTTGDLLVRLERSGVIAVGDLVAGDRNPWAGDADLSGWISTLNALSKLQPEIVVPLRGAPLDPRAVRVQREAFSWTKGRVEAGYVDLLPSGRIPDRVLADPDLAKYFDLDARPCYVESVVNAALRAVQQARRKRGLPD
jgi:glyoxylase-like metal-dependent hydrolase (beta-lactamase superfamily II)